MLKKLLSHTLIYGLASQVPKVAGVLALPIITADLTSRDFGIYGIIIAYSSSIEVLGTLGLRVSLINAFYKKESRFKKYWSHLYGFLSAWTVPYSLIQFLLVYAILPDDVGDKFLTAGLTVGASLFFGPISLLGSTFYQLKEKPVIVGSIGIVGGILTVALNVFFISYLKLGYLGWFWSTFISGIVVNVIYFYLINFKMVIRPTWVFNFRFIRRSLGVSLPTIPHFYSLFLLNSADRIVMNQLNVTTEDIGKYNVAYTVGNIFQSIAMASGFAITPLMMRCYQQNDELSARKLVWFLQAIFVFTTFLACLWMKELFFLLVKNDTLNKMYYLGIIIVMSFNYRPIYYGAVNKLIYLEKTRVLWRLSLVPGIVNVILNFVFIPFYGFEFAALATFLSFTLVGVIGYFQKEYVSHRVLLYYPEAWMLLNIVLTITAYYLRDINYFWKFGLTAGFGASALLILFHFWKLRKTVSF